MPESVGLCSNEVALKKWETGDSYNEYISEEFNSFRKDAWKKQLTKHLTDKSIKILDVGTGPGFFSCILAEEGYDVTGIDFSEGMLEHAKENAHKLGVNPEFIKMDINNLEFKDMTFDVILSRNVTWTLPDPETTYSEFKRILKPNGKLIIYDANWHLHFFDKELMEKVRFREAAHKRKYGNERVVSDGDAETFIYAPLTHTKRPEWDEKILNNLGFDVKIDESIQDDLYEEWEKELYAESPLFEICAIKGELNESESNMYEYWQERSSTFGFGNRRESIEELSTRLSRYIPDGRQKVLDVGTGTGEIAAAVAYAGHEVTGIDLCSNMIKKAKENTERMNLQVNFMVTEADELPFEDNTFDVIVSRNLIWALPEPEETLKQWRRVLKPNGILVYLDGNHYYYYFNEEDHKNHNLFHDIKGEGYRDHPGEGKTFSTELCDETAKNLPLSKLNRPNEWDYIVLPKLGFEIFAEEVNRPQIKLKRGIADGFFTSFLIAAINEK